MSDDSTTGRELLDLIEETATLNVARFQAMVEVRSAYLGSRSRIRATTYRSNTSLSRCR